MDAASLRDGFRVGDWHIEPRAARATGPAGRSVELSPSQTQLLVALAVRHGEAVPKRELRAAVWADAAGGEERLRETIASLRALFGEHPRHPRYIASVGHDAYALVAHFDEAPLHAEPRGQRKASLHRLLGELRRRNVVKVAVSYLVAMWIVLQVAEVTFAPLRFPDWWMTALTIVAIIGLPVVVVLAWTYEITPQGVVLDPGAAAGTGVVTLPRPRARQSLAPAMVGGVALMAVVTGFAWWRSIDARVESQGADTGPSDAAPRSVAILPLIDLSPNGGNAWLGDGLSEELSTRLAQVPGIRVAARTSAFEYRDKAVDVRRIGQSLGVAHVLEGSVRREGDTVRVTVQLIDTRSGYHVWAGNFDRAWREVLDLQDDIAGAVTDALEVVLREDAGSSRAADGGRVEADALQPYLEGLALLRQSGDRSAVEDAVRRFEAAVAADPAFGRAFAGLCTACVARYRHTRDPEDLASAEHACRKALKVSPDLTESEQALAGLYVTSGRYDVASAMYRALIAKNPRDSDNFTGLAQALEGLGRPGEAEVHYRRAAEVEPGYWGAHQALGGFLFSQGRMAEAAVAYRRAADLVPSSASAWNNLGAALFMQGDVQGAVPIYEKSLALEPSRSAYSNLATAYYLAGRFAEAVDTYGKATATAPNDHTLWGNLADAQWQRPESREQARGSYGRAIELAERDRGLGAGDPMLLAQLGYYLGRVGDCARGREYLAEAGARGASQMYVQYFAALSAADCGDPATLRQAAAEALRLGYPKALLEIDPALKGKLTVSRS